MHKKISFHCWRCSAGFTVPSSAAGKRARCPKCCNSLVVPSATKSPPIPTPPVAQVAPETRRRPVLSLLVWLVLLSAGFAGGRLAAPRPYTSTERADSLPAVPASPRVASKPSQQRPWDKDQLSRRLLGLTFAQVRTLLGNPNSIGPGCPEAGILGGPGGGSGSLDYQRQLQRGALGRGSGEASWVYFKLPVVDPATGKESREDWMICFCYGRVYSADAIYNGPNPNTLLRDAQMEGAKMGFGIR